MTSESPLRSVGRWRRELSNPELDAFEEVLGAHMLDLGYMIDELVVGSAP